MHGNHVGSKTQEYNFHKTVFSRRHALPILRYTYSEVA